MKKFLLIFALSQVNPAPIPVDYYNVTVSWIVFGPNLPASKIGCKIDIYGTPNTPAAKVQSASLELSPAQASQLYKDLSGVYGK